MQRFGLDSGDGRARLLAGDGSAVAVERDGVALGEVRWPMLGRHSVMNALAARAAAAAIGVDPAALLPALARFRAPKRRMERLYGGGGIEVFDDFAHHPTAIRATLDGLRAQPGGRIVVALEPRSNSMRLGVHAAQIAPALAAADRVLFLARPDLPWNAGEVLDGLAGRGRVATDADGLLAALLDEVRSGDRVVFMSNGGFDGVQRRFVTALARRAPAAG